MLIKLAIYNDRRQEKNIKLCCERYASDFLPLIDNIFGIVTKYQYKRSYGQESGGSGPDFNVDSFVNIYNCAKRMELERNKLVKLFRNAYKTPYVGALLDNQFFFNLMLFCGTHSVKFNLINIRFDYGEYGIIDDFEETKKLFLSSSPHDFKTLKLHLIIENTDMIIDEGGYIDITSNEDVFDKYKDLILDMLISGLGGDAYGKSH